MRRLAPLLLLLLPIAALGQGTRVDSYVITSAKNVPAGAQAQLYSVPFAAISVCALPNVGSPCTNTVPIYSDQALTQQMSQPLASDSSGRYGFWIGSGTYTYSVVGPTGIIYGTFPLSVGGGSSGGSTTLTGAVTGSGTGTVATTIAPVATAGTYSLSGVATINAAGQVLSIGPAFTISAFSCTANGTFEVGNATTNPNTCTFGYTAGTPISGTLTDSLSHTGTFTTPFASGTLAYQYCTVGQGATAITFYGNASSSTQTAAQVNQSSVCSFRTWAGGGSGAPTSATASGTSLVLNGGFGTLASSGLGNTYAGQSFTLSLSAQYPVLVLTGGCGHTFSINGLPTTFSCTAYTVTNQYGASEATGIYTGPATLTGSPIVTVNSL